MKKIEDITGSNTLTMEDRDWNERYLAAEKRLKQVKGFYHHVFWYVVVNIAVIAVIALSVKSSDEFWDFGTFGATLFWGIGLLFHGIGVFGNNILFSKDWEKRKIKEYMEREEQETRKIENQ